MDIERLEDKPFRRHGELNALAELMNCGVLLLDAAAGLQFASAYACRLLGYKSQAAVKKDWPSVFQKLDLRQMERQQEGGEPVRIKIDFPISICANGANGAPDTVRLLRLEIYPFERENRGSFLVLLKDRQVLDGLGMQLLLASQIGIQSYLAHAFVHDINGPINNIQLTLELLKSGLQNAGMLSSDLLQRLQRYQTVLKEELLRLSGLIRTLPGELSPPASAAEPFDVRTVVDEIVRRLKHEAAARQIRRSLISSPVPLWTNGSRGQIRLALFSLAIMLLEATRPGGLLTIVVEKSEAGAEIGIRSDNAELAESHFAGLRQLFFPTQQNGSGVFAARLAIESQGGGVTMEKQSDKGIGVRVLLPLSAAQHAHAGVNEVASSE